MEPVVIEFIGDTRGLEPAIEQLKALGQVTDAQYDQFVSSNKKAEEAIAKVERRVKSQTDATVKDIGEQTQAMQQLSEAIPLKVIEENGKQMEKAAAKSKSLKQQLREVKEEMAQLELAGKANTQRFKELATQGGILTDQLGDTSAQLRNLGNDEKYIQAVGQAMTGVVGIFSAGQGAVALFGDENEELQKTMMRLFATMSIVQGLESAMVALNKDSVLVTTAKTTAQKIYNYFVDQGTGKLIAFRVATAGIVTLGIAAAIIAVTYAFKQYNEQLEIANASANRLKKINEAAIEIYSQQAAELTGLIAIVKNENSTNEQKQVVLQTVNEKYGEQIGHFENIEDLENRFIERGEAYVKVLRLRAQAQAAMNLATEAYEEKLRLQNTKLDDQLTFWDKTKVVVGSVTKLYQISANVADDVAARSAKNIAKTEDDFNAFIEMFNEFSTEAAGLVKKFNFDVIPEEAKKTVAALREAFNALGTISPLPSPEKLKTDILEPSIVVTKDYNQQVIDGSKATKEALIADLEAIKQKRLEGINYSISVAQQAASVIASFNQNAYDKDVQALDYALGQKQISQKQYDEQVKAAQIKKAKQDKGLAAFSAVLNTASAITGILASTSFDPTGILRTIQIAVASAIGAAQLAAILSSPIPGFKKGTPNAPAGFKWVGEAGPELINDKGGYPIINNDDSMALVSMLSKYNIPSVPSLSEASLNMLSAGYGVPVMPGMDYDKMAAAFAGEVKKNPGLNVNIDQNGFLIFLQKQFGTTYFIDNKYRKN